ncbi:MAG: TonB-dependent receptor [Pseudomonadales bacterium]
MAFTVAPVHAQPATSNSENIEEVVVTGIRGSLKASLERKRLSDQVAEIIVAEDIGKFPDQNVAESLQRVPGVTITRGSNISVGDNDGAGEGSEVSVRGTPAGLNNATVNGQTIGTTSSQGGSRTFNYNTIAPELVDNLQVYKTPTAKMDEGSLGGTVNLVTRSPLNFKERQLVLGIKKMDNELPDDGGEDYSLLYADQFADNRFGLLLSVNQSKDTFRRDSFESFGYRYVSYDPATMAIADRGNPASAAAATTCSVSTVMCGYMPKDIRQNIRFEERDRLGVNLVLQWRPTDSLEFKFDYLDTELERQDASTNHAFRFTDAPGGVNLTRIQDAVVDGDNFVAVTDSTSTNRNHKRYFIALFDRTYVRETDAYSLRGDWDGDNWSASVILGGSNGKGTQDPSLFATFGVYTPISYDMRNARFATLDAGVEIDITDPAWDSSAFIYGNGGLSRALRYNEDEEDFVQIDVAYDIDSAGFTSIEFGVKSRDRSKNQYKAVDPTSGAERSAVGKTLEDYLNTNRLFPVSDFSVTGGLPRQWAFPDVDLVLADFSYDGLLSNPTVRVQQDATANWDVNEEIFATYAMASFATQRWRGNFGVRYVNTDQTGNSNSVVRRAGNVYEAVPLKDDRSYSEVLPSVNFVFNIQDDLLLRGGYAKVMARPSFEQLTLGYNINEGAGTATRGNPGLDPFLADQYDLSLEWYFADSALLSAAVFYKDVESFVTQNQADEVITGFETDDTGAARTFIVTFPDNGDGAKITGYEFAYQQNFTFLPGPLDGFGMLANITILDSSTALNDPFGRELPLEGLAEMSLNLVLHYEKNNYSGRLSYTRRDEFLLFTSSLGGLPVYNDEYTQIDASARYDFWDSGFSVTLEGINLNDEPVVSYAGDSSRLISYRNFGRRYALGVRYKF